MSSSRRPSAAAPAAVPALLFAILLLVAACASSSSPTAQPAGPTLAPSATSTAAPSLPPTVAPTATLAPAATGTPVPSAPATFPVTVTDDEGTTVSIPTRPARIVSLTPATTEILFAIGAGNRVIARTDSDDFPPEAVTLPIVVSNTSVDVEKIVSMKADLVIAGGSDFTSPAAVEKLRSLGIPVVVVYGKDLGTVVADVRLVGIAAGEGAKARVLADSMAADFEAVSAAVAGRPKQRVFYEIDASNGIFGPAPGSFAADILARAGADPILAGPDYSISLEKLVAADPEVILLGDAAYGVTKEIVAARPGWGTMTAVKTGAILPVNDTVITRPGPRLTEGLRAVVAALHPDVPLPSPPSIAP